MVKVAFKLFGGFGVVHNPNPYDLLLSTPLMMQPRLALSCPSGSVHRHVALKKVCYDRLTNSVLMYGEVFLSDCE